MAEKAGMHKEADQLEQESKRTARLGNSYRVSKEAYNSNEMTKA